MLDVELLLALAGVDAGGTADPSAKPPISMFVPMTKKKPLSGMACEG